MKAFKVLISAYACEPNKGSEPGVGWNWAKQTARFHQVWVITRSNNRASIEKEPSRDFVDNLHFIYYDVPKWASFWKKKTRGLHLYYLLWQIGVYRIAKKLHKKIQFDLVHHITFGNIWLPTFMSFLRIPFLWGPIGGAEKISKKFRKSFPIKSKVREIIRSIIISSLKCNLLFRYNCKNANIIIAKTRDTASIIPDDYRDRVTTTIDVGIEHTVTDRHKINCDKLQILSVGKMDAWRGFDILLKSFSKAVRSNGKMSLAIVGNGSERHRLQNIIKEERLQNRVFLPGHLDKNSYLDYMAKSAIFVNPCLKEGGATTLLDAMSFGLPVICFDISGSSEIVTEKFGIKIKLLNCDQILKDLADAVLKLANNPNLRKKIGEAGRQRVKEFYNWDKKGEFIQKIYQLVFNK